MTDNKKEIGILLTATVEFTNDQDSNTCTDLIWPVFLEWFTLDKSVELVKWNSWYDKKVGLLGWNVTVIAYSNLLTDRAVGQKWNVLLRQYRIPAGEVTLQEVAKHKRDLQQVWASLMPGFTADTEPDTDSMPGMNRAPI